MRHNGLSLNEIRYGHATSESERVAYAKAFVKESADWTLYAVGLRPCQQAKKGLAIYSWAYKGTVDTSQPQKSIRW